MNDTYVNTTTFALCGQEDWRRIMGVSLQETLVTLYFKHQFNYEALYCL